MNILKIFGIILIVMAVAFSSCRTKSSVSKSMDKIKETKDAKAKVVQQQYDKAIKRHQSIQTKKTRKRMDQAKKKADKWTKKHIGNVPNCPAVK